MEVNLTAVLITAIVCLTIAFIVHNSRGKKQ